MTASEGHTHIPTIHHGIHVDVLIQLDANVLLRSTRALKRRDVGAFALQSFDLTVLM